MNSFLDRIGNMLDNVEDNAGGGTAALVALSIFLFFYGILVLFILVLLWMPPMISIGIVAALIITLLIYVGSIIYRYWV